MKTFKITILYLFVALTSVSCGFYNSAVPISSSKHSTIDSTYIGNWKSLSDHKEIITLEVTTNHKDKYIISGCAIKTQCDKNKIKIENTIFSAYNTTINKTEYFNISILNDKSDKFVFGKLKIENDTLLVYLLSDDFVTTFSKSRKFKNHITNNQIKFNENFKLIDHFVKQNKWIELNTK